MFDSAAFPHQSKQYSLTPKIEMATPVQNRPIMHCKPFGIEYVMYAYGLHLFYLNLLLLIMKNVDSIQMTITNTVLLPNLHCHLRGKNLLENAENGISERLDFKISWGACPQTPLEARTFGAHFPSRLHLFASLLLQNLLKALMYVSVKFWRMLLLEQELELFPQLSQDSVIICCMIACSYGTIMV